MSTQFICDVCGATNGRSETYGPERPYRFLHQDDKLRRPNSPTIHLTVTPKVDPGEDVCGACVLRAIEGLIKCMANPLPKDVEELEEQLTALARAEGERMVRGDRYGLPGLAKVQEAMSAPSDATKRPLGSSYLEVPEPLGGEYAAPDSPASPGPDPDVQPVPAALEGTGTRSDGIPRPLPQHPEHYHFYSIHPDGREWGHWASYACPIEGCDYYECAPKDKGPGFLHLTRYLTPAER